MRDNREPKLLCALLLAGVAQLAWTGAAGSEIGASATATESREQLAAAAAVFQLRKLQ